MLMTTDPGDLVLDPTCGSGVTADVAEEWGRRRVTIDVSRVAVAVARQKLATSVYTWHRTTDGTSLVVRLLGCDTYDPSTGAVRETNQDHIDCWMIDTDHDQMSFVARLTYFPNGLRNDAGLKAAMRSLGPDLVPDAQSHIISFRSQPFAIPPDDRPIAVKAITDTGAEMNSVIHPHAWQAPPEG